MKILHVIPTVAASDGGPAKAVVEMCRDSNKRGAEAEIYTTNLDGTGVHAVACGKPIEVNGVRITYFPVAFSNFFKISPALVTALKSKIPDCDVVHIHSLYQFPSTAAAFYCRRFEVPYILRPHGTLDPYLHARHRGRKWLYELLFERRNLRDAAAVHFTTDDEMRLAQDSGLQFNPVVIALGVDFQRGATLRRDRTAMEERWPKTTNKKVILFLGRINFKKGLDILARAFGQIARVRDDVFLMIAGPDSDGLGARVREWLAEEGVLDRTIFAGMVTGDDKSAIWAGASMFVLPSHSENFGIAVVEAMASGLPVVISDAVNLAPAIAAAEAGLVVKANASEMAKAIERLLNDDTLAHRNADNGIKLARESFSWDAAGPKLMEMYDRVVANSRDRTKTLKLERDVARTQ